MSLTTDKAYEAYKKRQTEKKDKSQSRTATNVAYENYKKRKQESAQSAMEALYKDIESEINQYNGLELPSFGAGADKTATESTRERTQAVKHLRTTLNSYKNYIEEEAYNSALKSIDSLDEGYKSYLEGAKIRSQFESEDDYNNAVKQAEEYEAMRTFDLDKGKIEVDELEAQYKEAGSILRQYENSTNAYRSSAFSKEEKASLRAEIEKHGGYKGYKDYLEGLSATLAEKKAYYGRAERIQTADGMEKTYKALGNSENLDAWETAFDEAQALQVQINSARDSMAADGGTAFGTDESWKSARETLASEYGFYNEELAYAKPYMSDEEFGTYMYYYEKIGAESAMRYLDSIEERINAKVAKGYVADVGDNFASKIVFAASAGLDQFATGIDVLFNPDEKYYVPSATQMASAEIREDMTAVGGVVYDLASTTANMTPSILVGMIPYVGQVAGVVTLGASAAGNAYAEMVNLGYSKDQATSYAALVGGSEAGLSYLLGGIGKLGGKAVSGIVSKIDDIFGKVAVNAPGLVQSAMKTTAKIGAKMGSEGLEEGLQSILEPWFKSIATNTEFEGVDWGEVRYSALLGALSAGILEGPSTIVGDSINYRKTTKVGENVLKTDGGLERLKTLGSTMSMDSAAYKIAGQVNEETGAYSIGRLFNEVGASMSEQNRADIVNSLVSKGMATSDAETIATWLGKAVEGEYFTDEQIEAIDGNEKIAETLVEVVINPNSTVNQRLMSLAETVSNKSTPTETATETAGDKETAKASVSSPTVEDPTEAVKRVSESGKTERKSTGEEIVIDKNNPIAKTKIVDGEKVVYFNTDKGKVSSADVLYASEDEGLLYESFVDMNPAFANAIIKNYDRTVPIQTYIKGMREGVIVYGMHNFQAVGKDISKNSFLAGLSETDQNFALKLGRAYAKSEAKKADNALRTAIKNAKDRAEASSSKTEQVAEESSEGATQKKAKKGGVSFEKGVHATTTARRRVVSLAKHLSKAIGIDIVFYDARTTTDPNGRGSNGYFNEDTNAIHLDIQYAGDDAKTIAFTLSHELVHFIRNNSETQFNTFAEFLLEQYAAHGVNTSKLLADKMAELGTKDADFAYEEMIADACETMLLDSNAAVKLMELRKTDLNLFETIKLHILELLQKIRDEYKRLGLEPASDEAKALLKMEDVLEQIHEKFEEALVGATENYQASIGERNLSAESSADSGIKRQAKREDASYEGKYSYKQFGEDFYKEKKIYSYDFLTHQKPMDVLSLPALGEIFTNGRVDRDHVITEGKKNALAQEDSKSGNNDVVFVKNKYIQRMIEVNNHSIRHSLGGKPNYVLTNARLGLIIGDVVRNGIPINELNPSNGADGTFAMVAYAVSPENKPFLAIAHIDVQSGRLVQYESREVVHSLRGRIKNGSTVAVNSAPGLSGDNVSVNTSTISIAHLLKFVNSVQQSILSDDVLKYFEEERATNGYYYGEVKHQKKEVTNRTILANTLESSIDTSTQDGQNELQWLKEYQSKVALIEQEEARLAEIKEEIYSTSFTKGADRSKLKELNEEKTRTANRINTYDKQLLRLEAMKPIKDVLQREKELVRKRTEEKGREALDAYREKMTKTQRELLARASESRRRAVERVRETRDKGEAKDKLQKLILKTIRWLSYPKKEDVKCPDILKEPYAEFLKSIDLSSKRLLNGGEPTQNDLRLASAMDSLATAIEKIKTAQNPNVTTEQILDSGYLDLPENFVEILRTMAENIKGKMVSGNPVVNDMHSTDVKAITKLIRTLNHAIKEMSTLYANLRFANVEVLGDNSITFLEDLGELDSTSGVKDFVGWDNALPYYAFKRFGEGGESIFEELMDAQDKLAFLASEIFAFKDKTWTDKEAKEWGEDTHTINLPSGHTLTLTTADAMSIYCLSRRHHALGHLFGGGVAVVGKKKGVEKQPDSRSHLTDADVKIIVDSLTDKQKSVAEKMQEFMSTVCAEWGNEISMKRFLTKMFTEQFYFPIESNPVNMDLKDPEAQKTDLFRLLNISATKPLTKGANNEIVIRNIFDVFAAHTSDMARLNAYGMALLDCMKWINYREKSVDSETGEVTNNGLRKSLETTYGTASVDYIVNLIKDVNGSGYQAKENSMAMKLIRGGKTAAVGANLRVAMLQITSLPRASAVLSPKSLLLGAKKLPNIKKAKKYCGIALWKSFGFYDTNITKSVEAQIKGDKTLTDKVVEVALKGAEMGDSLVWGYLWNACEYEVAQTKKYEVGTEEFYQAVGKKLREVVYATQVVDSTLTRSQMMRNKSGLSQMITAFMSEPTLSYNMMLDCQQQFSIEKRKTGSAKMALKKTWKHTARVTTVFMMTSLGVALASALADAYRDDDDEPFGDKFMEAFVPNLLSEFNLFNKIPVASDISNLVEAMLGYGYVSSNSMSSDYIETLKKAYDAWADIYKNGDEAEKTLYYAIYNTTKALSQFTGLPINNAMREAVTLWNNTVGEADYTKKIRTYEDSSYTQGDFLYDAIVSGDDKRADKIEATFEDQDAIDSALRRELREEDPRIKEAAEARFNGDIGEYTDIFEEILAEGNFSRELIYSAINAEYNAMKPDEEDESEDEATSIYTKEDYYAVLRSGDTATMKDIEDDIRETMKANGKTEDDVADRIESWRRSFVKDAYMSGVLLHSEAIQKYTQLLTDEDENDAYWMIDKWDYEREHGTTEGYSKYTEFHTAVESGRSLKSVIQEYTSHGVTKQTLASQITSYFKPLYKEMSKSERANLKGYLLNAYGLLGYDRTKKSKDIDKWIED